MDFSQSALIRGPHNLRRSKDPSPATGEGALKGEWSLSPTINDNKKMQSLSFQPLAPAPEPKPLLSPSRVTNAMQQILLPTMTTLSGLSQPWSKFRPSTSRICRVRPPTS